jgi:hypothetical protein
VSTSHFATVWTATAKIFHLYSRCTNEAAKGEAASSGFADRRIDSGRSASPPKVQPSGCAAPNRTRRRRPLQAGAG